MDLPAETVDRILYYATPSALSAIARTCKQLHNQTYAHMYAARYGAIGIGGLSDEVGHDRICLRVEFAWQLQQLLLCDPEIARHITALYYNMKTLGQTSKVDASARRAGVTDEMPAEVKERLNAGLTALSDVLHQDVQKCIDHDDMDKFLSSEATIAVLLLQLPNLRFFAFYDCGYLHVADFDSQRRRGLLLKLLSPNHRVTSPLDYPLKKLKEVELRGQPTLLGHYFALLPTLKRLTIRWPLKNYSPNNKPHPSISEYSSSLTDLKITGIRLRTDVFDEIIALLKSKSPLQSAIFTIVSIDPSMNLARLCYTIASNLWETLQHLQLSVQANRWLEGHVDLADALLCTLPRLQRLICLDLSIQFFLPPADYIPAPEDIVYYTELNDFFPTSLRNLQLRLSDDEPRLTRSGHLRDVPPNPDQQDQIGYVCARFEADPVQLRAKMPNLRALLLPRELKTVRDTCEAAGLILFAPTFFHKDEHLCDILRDFKLDKDEGEVDDQPCN